MKPRSAPAPNSGRLAALQTTVAQQGAVIYVLDARVAELERALARDRAAQPVDLTWVGPKDAAFRMGVSLRQIYQLIDSGKVESQRRGGRILVNPSTLPHCKVTPAL